MNTETKNIFAKLRDITLFLRILKFAEDKITKNIVLKSLGYSRDITFPSLKASTMFYPSTLKEGKL